MSAQNPNGQWSTDKVDTSVTGATFVSLPSHDCDEILIVNATGYALEVRAAGSTDGVKIPDGSGAGFPMSGNSKEAQVRRFDQSNTPVSVRFIWRKF